MEPLPGRYRPETDAFSRALAGVIPSISLLALLVVALIPFRDELNTGTVALVLILPPLVASLGGLPVALGMSVVCALTFNFFFTQPYYTLRIESSESVAAFVIYLLVTCIVALFSSRLREARDAAARSASEDAFLQASTVELLTTAELAPAARSSLHALQELFALRGVYLQVNAPSVRRLDEGAGEYEDARKAVVRTLDPRPEDADSPEGSMLVLPVTHDGAVLGALGIDWGGRPAAAGEGALLHSYAEVLGLALDRS